ncbi:MAG: hypothetical protein HQL13_03890 [Candidatus Omnitrophica bacterium]|nr:hypothetical protein [Candidatus Omnitrophota bacterium]
MQYYIKLKSLLLWLIIIFLIDIFSPGNIAYSEEFILPRPGVLVHLSPVSTPPILKGIRVYPDNPFRFDFILGCGDSNGNSLSLEGRAREGDLKQEATKLIKYFLASITVPEKDRWVNLSPYEKGRILPQSFGLTEMGRDLLAEDYLLKQITASLIYPEDKIGKKFWQRVYQQAAKRYGTTNVSMNTFNKVWIMPEKAVVYENEKAGTAYVVEAGLKVLLEEDYLAREKALQPARGHIPQKGTVSCLSRAMSSSNNRNINSFGSNIVREIVIPELTKEVNENKNFAQLRQAYNSLILATWYKEKIKDSLLDQFYADKNKVAGVGYQQSVMPLRRQKMRNGPNDIEAIYQLYLQAFKKGVYNYIKEDIDLSTQTAVSRKHFSGGMVFDKAMRVLLRYTNQIPYDSSPAMQVMVDMAMANGRNNAMTSPPSVWADSEQGKSRVIEAIRTYIPDIIDRYQRIDDLNYPQKQRLRDDIYKITSADFQVWGLSAATDKEKAPYFGGTYINVLKVVFSRLSLNEFGFGPDWSTRERGIDYVRFVLARERPDIMERYEHLETLSLEKRAGLIDEIYKIKSGRFKLWGLGDCSNKKRTPYFNGSYINALQLVFPQLGLDSLGFQLDWTKRGVDSIRFVFRREIPDIMRRYDDFDSLNEEQRTALREDIYGIKKAHFSAWNLDGFTNQEEVLFQGSYISALQLVFDKLGLDPLGFHHDWSSEKRATASIRYVLTRERPDIMSRYERLDATTSMADKKQLLEDIYRITRGHFTLWGIATCCDPKVVRGFQGDYVKALHSVFDNPILGFSEQGLKDFRKEHKQNKYTWLNEEIAKDNVRDVLRVNMPDIWERYNRFDSLNLEQQEELRKDVYRITAAHLRVWGIARGLDCSYFNGSFITALQMVLPKLELNPFGFQLDWSSSERKSIDSIKYVLYKERPDIMRRFDRLSTLSLEDKEELRQDIYKISKGYFTAWELGGALKKKGYFNGSYIKAFQAVFEGLYLDPLGFELDWSSPQRRLDSIRYVLRREIPDIMVLYDNWDSLNLQDREYLIQDIYKISSAHFQVWGLSGCEGSFIEALQDVFSSLVLDPLGFQLDWSSRSKGIESVRFVFKKKRPDIIRDYDRLDSLNEQERGELVAKIKGITYAHFMSWRLGGALSKKVAPYFKGNYSTVLQEVFDRLPGLNNAMQAPGEGGHGRIVMNNLRNTGGVDFTLHQIRLRIQKIGHKIRFIINPVLLKQLENLMGLVPVIIKIEPIMNIKSWLSVGGYA